jgi:Flp pilus assembly protein TadG
VTAHLPSHSWLVSERGTTAIEYAIILPAFLLCTLGILDTGRLFWTNTTMQRAVSMAARCASTQCASAAQIKDKAIAEAWGLELQSQAVTIVQQNCGMRVTASYPFVFSVPGFDPITLTSTSCFANGP